MVTMTLAIPMELKEKMNLFPEIKWSQIARQAFNSKVSELEILNQIKSKSEFTKEDAIELGRDLNKNLLKKYIKRNKLNEINN
jgi:hypothetical protein